MPEQREFSAVPAPSATPARTHLDLSVYLVTDTTLCGGPDGVVATVRQAVESGATLVQLRDSQLPDDEFVRLGRRLVDVLAGSEVPLLINDRIELVEAIGADGAHVGQSDASIAHARDLLGAKAIVGLSAASADQIAAALSCGLAAVDYLGVGALRSTFTKPDAAPVGISRLREVAALSPWPVCAIGGVTAADAALIAESGASGMAVVSAICGQPDVHRATTNLVTAWQQTITTGRRQQ